MEKKIMGEKEYQEYLDRMFESAKKIGAAQERLKDYKHEEQEDVELHIVIFDFGFQVSQNNKTFICQTGEQLVNHLKSLNTSESQLLEIFECVLGECMKRGIDFPTHLI